jgi:hypothetical protein
VPFATFPLYPPPADVGADIVEPPVSAINGQSAPQQFAALFDHLVGAGELRRRHDESSRINVGSKDEHGGKRWARAGSAISERCPLKKRRLESTRTISTFAGGA